MTRLGHRFAPAPGTSFGGGSRPGDLIEVEARDVVFEPFMGHTLRFPRMRWRVRLTEPINYP